MATATMTKKTKKTEKVVKVNYAERARSPIVQAIYEQLDRKSWTSRTQIVEAMGHLIPNKQALEVFEERIGRGRPIKFSRTEKLERGRAMKVLLDCITLVQSGKVEQRGRGETKEYRLV